MTRETQSHTIRKKQLCRHQCQWRRRRCSRHQSWDFSAVCGADRGEAAVPLQPVEDKGDAEIHLQLVEKTHAGAVCAWRTASNGRVNHVAAVPGELLPMEWTYVEEVCGKLSPVGRTPCWRRRRTPLPEQPQERRNVWTDHNPHSLSPCVSGVKGGRAQKGGVDRGRWFWDLFYFLLSCSGLVINKFSYYPRYESVLLWCYLVSDPSWILS